MEPGGRTGWAFLRDTVRVDTSPTKPMEPYSLWSFPQGLVSPDRGSGRPLLGTPGDLSQEGPDTAPRAIQPRPMSPCSPAGHDGQGSSEQDVAGLMAGALLHGPLSHGFLLLTLNCVPLP